ncbi:MAG: hypothetical protein CL834_03745 [Crocinitomicaceae bacterium]|nr:hypothetical protein [Crocinitomicaceae bacterium]
MLGCIEQRFELGEDMPISGEANPAFGISLGSGTWTVQQALDQVDSLHWDLDQASGSAMFVRPFELLESPPIELPLINEGLDEVFELDEATAYALSNLPEAEQLSLAYETSWTFELPSMDSVDSLWLDQGILSVFITSDIPMDQSIQLICTNLFAGGTPIVLNVEMEYAGQLPFEGSAVVSTANARGIFPNDDGLEVMCDWDIVLESSGTHVNEGASISIEVQWQDANVSGAFGKFGSQTSVDFNVAQPLPLLEVWDQDQLHFADPRIRLNARNSSGIPIGVQWNEFAFISNLGTWDIGGPDITEFPVIPAANSVGSSAQMVHVVDNSGTSPTLSEALEMRPDSAILRGQLVVNPASESSNFLTNESTLEIDGALEVPLTGWGMGLTWRDTLREKISSELNAAINPPLDWQDVESVALRFIAENGWPLGMDLQVSFIDGDDLTIDSLSENSGAEAFHIAAGQVDHSLGSADLHYGRVMKRTQTIMDIVLTRDQATELLSLDCEGIEIALTLGTPDAQNGSSVRFFPEDEFELKLSARVSCAITLEQ